MNRYRSVLVLVYVVLFVVAFLWLREEASSSEGFLVLFAVVAGLALLVLVVLAYLCSLALAGLLYRLRAPVWIACAAGTLLGPAAALGLIWVGLRFV